MATKIVTKNSSTASAVPTASDLVQGELAVNVADKRLFTEDNAGAIVELGTNPSTQRSQAKSQPTVAIFGDGSDVALHLEHPLPPQAIFHAAGTAYLTNTKALWF